MDCSTRFLPYEKTGLFSSLVLDYLRDVPEIKNLYSHRPDKIGFEKAIADRKRYSTDRKLVYTVFNDAYSNGASQAQKSNIESLLSPETYTVCTAHQPNIFTGYLYFIYKIIHAIKLGEELKKMFPQSHFVPVYYMGSEDNDLEELGQVQLGGKKLEWKTKQKGAVGRMKVDKELLQLLNEIEAQIGIEPFGPELVSVLRNSYQDGVTIADATFRLVNHLFGEYGLLVLQADNASLKKIMQPVFEEDLFLHKPHELVSKTGELLHDRYKVQVNPREINLFYLTEGSRERITGNAVSFSVEQIQLQFTREELLHELKQNPERFSPNVVLRGIFQETILPNIAFIGGGAEIAYWLELKSLFDHYQVPFPVLVLRNSFLLMSKDQVKKLERMGLQPEDLFLQENEIMNAYVKKVSGNKIDIAEELTAATSLFDSLKKKVVLIDVTLAQHIEALQTKCLKQLETVSKKMLRAEKKKFETEKNQLQKIQGVLFPLQSLQERVENFMPWYARKGKGFIENIYRHSPSLQHEFGIIICD